MRQLALVAALICGTLGASAASTTPSDILDHPSAYDGRAVTVVGLVEAPRTHVSHKGNPYVTFELCAKSECLHVFEWGASAPNDGERLTVRGTFEVEKQVGRYTFHNEIEASNAP